MHVSYTLVFHRSKCISAKAYTLYCRHVYTLKFFHAFVCSLLLRCIFEVKRVVCGSEDVQEHTRPGVDNTSIAIDRSIVESKLIDRA